MNVTTPMIPRGIRNNNPGNIDRNHIDWQGMSADQSGDPRFVVFKAPVWGLRAMARILLAYQKRHQLKTIRGIIHRWAPPKENNTDAYVQAVAKKLNLGPDEFVDLSKDKARLAYLIAAIVQHENGQQPYPLELIGEAVNLATKKEV